MPQVRDGRRRQDQLSRSACPITPMAMARLPKVTARPKKNSTRVRRPSRDSVARLRRCAIDIEQQHQTAEQ